MKAAALAVPASTARPPVRGTGVTCSERAFGSSSAKERQCESNTRTIAKETRNESAVDAATMRCEF